MLHSCGYMNGDDYASIIMNLAITLTVMISLTITLIVKGEAVCEEDKVKVNDKFSDVTLVKKYSGIYSDKKYKINKKSHKTIKTCHPKIVGMAGTAQKGSQ